MNAIRQDASRGRFRLMAGPRDRRDANRRCPSLFPAQAGKREGHCTSEWKWGVEWRDFECISIAMREFRRIACPPPDIPGRRKDWREQIKADLAAQVEAGGTLYGVRSDGAYIARTKDGDRVLSMPAQKQA